ncbi:multifunctional oxoglutarate decarboxylase/oxoglutarate dehydrogenase thiamine pyrophosphate-binding subunit/dihydrolipoyllysine-residue succinyltransferase subunit [Kribbella sp. NPDC049227]|uniref:multifunctional oxoglutarate decarboxylase/oxoglutarate dehydrogenase thiamine pyrophosphate-binding subunit/dihydrolipoyllysine-residue succinyltransferase subunit n=1 Tax=Kribbella sp. NPDC049227 TaxID=3364113 RepID=UPI003722AAFB
MSVNVTDSVVGSESPDDPEPAQPQPAARTTSVPPEPAPMPADNPSSPLPGAQDDEAGEIVVPLRGVAKALATNMNSSLSVPTATSVRTVAAKLVIDNCIVMNNHLRKTRGGKISYTQLVGWALVQAVKHQPGINTSYDEIDDRPVAVTPAHVNLGIAVDLVKSDGTRTMVVPNIKRADTLGFWAYLQAYEDLVTKARTSSLTVDDFAGTTISLTNPGAIGTAHAMPRLMTRQGCVVGAGALEFPAEYQGMSQPARAELAIGATVTLTSTYDPRVIQGAASGEFLRKVDHLLTGGDGFYEDIFTELRIPYVPIQWARDIRVDEASTIDKTARVQALINAFRVRGHLMADIDPLEYVQRSHPDLDLSSHGLTFWDLDREFVTGDFAGRRRTMPLRDILGVLRDAYCRTIGVEYMHIQDPEQRRWFQERLERPYTKRSHDEQLRILGKLNEAEAFETFLQTKYIGQTRFSLEGSESVIALLDAILARAADAGLDGAAIAMAHRGRLNVLTNIAGKTYAQVFREFQDTDDTDGSGDVKYHLGTEGTYRGADGEELAVYLAANPSHLDAVDAVLLGIVRGKQDRHLPGTYATLPIIIHGDAAMAGQGVVSETVQMSRLRGYSTGGTIRINLNNQVGFTTLPTDARSSAYSTDVTKSIQSPVFHVNGDDPEAVVRVAELAFAYRQQFGRDVVIDLVCYRRRGHNEADDPSMTQPQMYTLIDAKRSVRTLYLEALVGRGDITRAEYEQADRDFHGRLERAFSETRGAPGTTGAAAAALCTAEAAPASTSPVVPAVAAETINTIGDAFVNPPVGFTIHPKLEQVLAKRYEMSRHGGIDWAFGELLAFGSLLLEGTPVRMVGQDSRRGTFVQRHAVLHDQANGQEWLPLTNVADGQARFSIYDSLLSEYAAMGFEYGYSVERPDALVLWEAQFGDFVNGAQIVVDEFLSSAEQKWNQRSSLVLLLPHGYEGRGPDHSSGRIERFLQGCAENNLTVAQPSTPASHFHLLRRQAGARTATPLVVFTPKSMLRTRGATSSIADLCSGRFEPVIDDTRITDKSAVQRVLVVSGKLYYELLHQLERSKDRAVALVRLEQFYPLPEQELRAVLNSYPNAECFWVQDEPRNQGAWAFLLAELNPLLNTPLEVVSRPRSAAPATGSGKKHAQEQAALIEQALR